MGNLESKQEGPEVQEGRKEWRSQKGTWEPEQSETWTSMGSSFLLQILPGNACPSNIENPEVSKNCKNVTFIFYLFITFS